MGESLTPVAQQALRNRLAANFRNLQSLKGRATLTVETPEISYTADAAIWFRRPDSLFVKVEAAFGIDVGWLFCANDRFVLYLPQQNLCYYGATQALPLEDFISFDMEYPDLLRLIFGEEQLEEKLDLHSVYAGKEWLLSGEHDSLSYYYRYSEALGMITRAEVRDAAGAALRVKTFERFSKKKNTLMPQTIRLQQPAEKRAIGLFYHSLALNDPFVVKNLSFRIAPNAQRIRLEE
jgi:hypothetical protein